MKNTLENYEENIGKKVCKKSKTGALKKFRSGLYFNTVKDVIDHPFIKEKAYTFIEDNNFIECRGCHLVDDKGKLIEKPKGLANTPQTNGNILVIHPVGLGKHDNTYFIARDRKRNFKFKICCFTNDCSAYIVEFESNIDKDLLNPKIIHESINKGIEKWDFELKTKLEDLFTSYFINAENLLQSINNKGEQNRKDLVDFGMVVLEKFEKEL